MQKVKNRGFWMTLNIIGLIILGFSLGSNYERHRYNKNEHFVVDGAVKEEMDWVFIDESYRNLSNHRIYIPERFGDIGAYRDNVEFLIKARSDSNGNIILRLIDVPAKLDTLEGFIPSDVQEEL